MKLLPCHPSYLPLGLPQSSGTELKSWKGPRVLPELGSAQGGQNGTDPASG